MAGKKTATAPSAGVMALIDKENEKEAIEMDKKAELVQSSLPQLVKYGNEFINLSDTIDKLEDEVKELKSRKEELRKHLIPQLMASAGLVDSKGKGSFTVPGRKIYLETRVQASVPEINRTSFFGWLRQKGHGDLIKETVHPSTLVSFVKECRENGTVLPPTVAVHEETVAKSIKTK